MARNNNSGNGTVVIELQGMDNDFERFLAEVTEVKKVIQELTSNVEKVKSLQDRILSTPSSDERLKSELDDVMSVIKISSQMVRSKLKEMKVENTKVEKQCDGLSLTTVRARTTQYSVLQQNFVDVMQQYQFTQIDYRDKCKARFKRQLEITGSKIPEDEIEDMLQQGNWSVFTEGIFVETHQAREVLKDVESRHQEILKLEQDLQDLHELFLEMALLVESQGEVVDNIAMNVASGQNYVDKGVQELKSAKKLQSKVRRKKICMAITITVIILIVALVVTLTVCM